MPLLGFTEFALDLVAFFQACMILSRLHQLQPGLFVGILLCGAGFLQADGRMQAVQFQVIMIVAIIIAFIATSGRY
jgi:hypothetical protein